MSEEEARDLLKALEGCLINDLRTCYIYEDKVIHVKGIIDRMGNCKVIVRINDHAPPHFHVIAGDNEATYQIKDCKLLKGKLAHREDLIVKDWYRLSRKYLIDCWNSLRASNNPAGEFIEA